MIFSWDRGVAIKCIVVLLSLEWNITFCDHMEMNVSHSV